MIYDKMDNIGRYKGISKWFDQAVDFLIKTDLNSLPFGCTEICENHVFINVMEVDTVEVDTAYFEIHKKYWDIQLDLEGMEKVQIGLGQGIVRDEFREDIDFGTYSNTEHMDCILGSGYFIICMNEEPHKPTLRYGNGSKVKKCVIKVEVDGNG